MEERDQGKRDPPKVHLQGEGRPFSVAPVRPFARILQAPVLALLQPLELPRTKQRGLLKAICTILGEYLGQVELSARKLDHAAALKALARIARDSEKLASELGKMKPDYLVAIEEHRRDANSQVSPPKFDFLHLVTTLSRLSRAAEGTRAALQVNEPGAPRKVLLDRAVRQLSLAFGEAKLEVVPSVAGSKDSDRRRLDGTGGKLLVALFQEFDPPTKETNLFGAWERAVGKKARPARSK